MGYSSNLRGSLGESTKGNFVDIECIFAPGEVFGEMAFLFDRLRTMDVYAATDDIRVLSLSEKTIRQMIESDGNTAAKFLLNLSKMLCRRLIVGD